MDHHDRNRAFTIFPRGYLRTSILFRQITPSPQTRRFLSLTACDYPFTCASIYDLSKNLKYKHNYIISLAHEKCNTCVKIFLFTELVSFDNCSGSHTTAYAKRCKAIFAVSSSHLMKKSCKNSSS